MSHPVCHYYNNNEFKQEGTVQEVLKQHIQPLITSNALLQLKGNGSRVANINWEMFLGKSPQDKTPDNLNRFEPFNYQVFKWFQLNLNPIQSERVVIQFDGDRILEDNLEDSDTLLQNYTGVLYGLVWYLNYLNKSIDIVVMLDKSREKWNTDQVYQWDNGLKQLYELSTTIHFIVYDLDMHNHREFILKDKIQRPDGKMTDIWGYKGYYNTVELTTFAFNEYSMLHFGVGEVPIDELTYLKYYRKELFERLKPYIKFYNLTRVYNKPDHTNIDISTIQNISICNKLIENINE